MAIERLQQSHREAMLRNIATGELNPLEPWDTRFSDVSKMARLPIKLLSGGIY